MTQGDGGGGSLSEYCGIIKGANYIGGKKDAVYNFTKRYDAGNEGS